MPLRRLSEVAVNPRDGFSIIPNECYGTPFFLAQSVRLDSVANIFNQASKECVLGQGDS